MSIACSAACNVPRRRPPARRLRRAAWLPAAPLPADGAAAGARAASPGLARPGRPSATPGGGARFRRPAFAAARCNSSSRSRSDDGVAMGLDEPARSTSPGPAALRHSLLHLLLFHAEPRQLVDEFLRRPAAPRPVARGTRRASTRGAAAAWPVENGVRTSSLFPCVR